MLQQGRLENPGGGVHFAYPSIAVNTNDDALVGYSRFSASQYPSANYAFRAGEDALSSLRDDTVLKAGEAPYYSLDPDRQLNLWGDWSATVVDPANDSDLWTIQEYAALPAGTNSRWGTWWGRVAPPANLALTMTDAPDPVGIGATLTYTLVVSNATPPTSLVIASGVKVTNTLPSGVSFVSATSTQGSCAYNNGVVTCDLGALPIGGKITISLVVTPTIAGQVTNKAGVFGNGPELSPADNIAATVTTVVPAADLGLLLTAAPSPVSVTSNLTYTLVVTNAGPATATGIFLTNTLPATVNFLSATSSQGTNSRNGSVIIYTLGGIASGASATATIRVACPTAGAITNSAILASTTFDPNSSNNSAQAITRVNSAPTISTVSNRTINEDAIDQVSFTINDAETPLASLQVAATSSNQGLIPDSNLVLSGSAGSRTATITPLPNQYGSATITLTVTDSDGATAKTTWTETVTSVNDPPTLDVIPSVTVTEDAPAFNVNLTGITSGAPNEADPLSVTAVSSNPAIVSVSPVSYLSPNTTGAFTLTPATHAYGMVTITVTVNDNQSANNTTARVFTVTVTPVNVPPTLNAIANLTLNEDASQQTVNLSGIGPGAANETNNVLSITAVSSNPSIVPDPTVTYTSPNTTGALIFTPVPNGYGAVTITVSVNDGQSANNTFQRAFVVTVNPVNDPPTLGPIANITLNEDPPLQTITLTGISPGAANETNDVLTITATSNNPQVVPNPSISYTSQATNATLSFTPVLNGFGVSTITVTVDDGQPDHNTTTRTFIVTVNAVNDPPTLNPIPSRTINEDAGQQTVNLTGITSGAANEIQTLTLTASNSNPALLTNLQFTYASPAATGTLRFTTVTNASGIAFITVTVNDGSPSNNLVRQTFQVTVNFINHAPFISSISDTATDENVPITVPFTVSDIETPANNLTLAAQSSNPEVIADAGLSFGGSGTNRTITVTPLTNAFGSSTFITVTVTDGNGASNYTFFAVDVNPVNHPPTISPIAPQVMSKDASLIVPFSVDDVETPVDLLTVSAKSSNQALVTDASLILGGSGASRTLTVNPVSNQTGTTLISILVMDGDGATTTNMFQLTVVFAPPLTISMALDLVTISWPTNPPGFTIQSRDGFSALTSWAKVTNAYVQADTRFYVTNPATPVTRFYRLVK